MSLVAHAAETSASRRPNILFCAGDLGQRIFQVPFSWRSLGVDLRGRSQILRVNYRTSHQIRRVADRLLSSDVADGRLPELPPPEAQSAFRLERPDPDAGLRPIMYDERPVKRS